MKNTVAIRREDLSKTGERRVAVVPGLAAEIVQQGHKLIVQPARHPETQEIKRAFADQSYADAGAEISEHIGRAKVVFGLKEIEVDHIRHDTAYLMFSHTHKGQKKNRDMLRTLKERNCTVIDYELITDLAGNRLITAFTYFAGYAGMIDSLWTLGKRWKDQGTSNPFSYIPQSIRKDDLDAFSDILWEVNEEIADLETPADKPPVICCFLGDGKTSQGAQKIYDQLPVEEIGLDELERVYHEGDRSQVYKLVLGIHDMFRLKVGAGPGREAFATLPESEKNELYFRHPEYFTSNMEQVLPYITILMNCILWSPEFPRTVTKDLMAEVYAQSPTLQVIGDITCDPNGSIEFSKETWIDNPVYIWNPSGQTATDGFEGEGVAVMAVTNLPCEFSADASRQFSKDLEPLLESILNADYDGGFATSGLRTELQNACILWKGEFTTPFGYMQEYL